MSRKAKVRLYVVTYVWATMLCFGWMAACTPSVPQEKHKTDAGDSKTENSPEKVRLLDGKQSSEPSTDTKNGSPDAGSGETVKDAGAGEHMEPATPDRSPSDTTEPPEPRESEKPPCEGVKCGANAVCQTRNGQCACLDGFQGNPVTGCTAIPKPSGWIGSPCKQDSDCSYTGAFCLKESQGYPGGVCSSKCTRLCPDKAGYPVTFCVKEAGGSRGLCLSRCDTSLFPGNGCRTGYLCEVHPRYNQSSIQKSLCVPKSWKPPTGNCQDSMNKQGDDQCFLSLISYGDARQKALVKRLLEGTATKKEALEFLDANYQSSQTFIKDELKVRSIAKNYSTGHNSKTPMKGMILHYTANQKEDGTIRYFLRSSAHASTHFVIGSVRNGLLVQLFSHKHRTWHAGSYNQNRFGIDFANAGYLKKSGSDWVDYAKRKYTLSLPLHGNQPVKVTGGIPGAHRKYARLEYWQPYTYYQLLSFLVVGRALHLVYNLDPKLCQRHGDVSSSRVDPGPSLPTTALLKLVFSKDDLFAVSWLNQYKVQADWISKNPNAR